MGINVFKRVYNVWYMLKKKCVNATTFWKKIVRKQRRVELKSVGNFVAKKMLAERANQFRTQYILKYFSKPYRPSDRLEKP